MLTKRWHEVCLDNKELWALYLTDTHIEHVTRLHCISKIEIENITQPNRDHAPLINIWIRIIPLVFVKAF